VLPVAAIWHNGRLVATHAIGTMLDGRFEVICDLGEGAVGEVYLTRNLELDRIEALKLLKRTAARALSSRFQHEATALSLLRHQNIVTLYDVGTLKDGRPFLSMEYAPGELLSSILGRGQVPLDRALVIVEQIADAIDHAHQNSVIHRDLKPSNLVIDEDCEGRDLVRILDFGIAKIVDGHERYGFHTTGNFVMGTPAYLAPELLGARAVDSRVDIYSLGCLAYELISGQPPFVGRPIQVCEMHLRQEPAPLSERVDIEIPEALDRILLSCLDKNPNRRLQRGSTLAKELRKIRNKRHRKGTSLQRIPMLGDMGDAAFLGQGTEPGVNERRRWESAVRQLAQGLLARGNASHALLLALTDVLRFERADPGDPSSRQHAYSHLGQVALAAADSAPTDRTITALVRRIQGQDP